MECPDSGRRSNDHFVVFAILLAFAIPIYRVHGIWDTKYCIWDTKDGIWDNKDGIWDTKEDGIWDTKDQSLPKMVFEITKMVFEKMVFEKPKMVFEM
jgi:hypothetical protein